MKKRLMALGLCAMMGFSAGNIQPVQAAVNIPSENAVAYTYPINGKGVEAVNSNGELWHYYLRLNMGNLKYTLDSSYTKCLMTGVKMVAGGNSDLMVLKNDGAVWAYHVSRYYDKEIYGPVKVFDGAEKLVAFGSYAYGVLKNGTLYVIEANGEHYIDGVLSANEYAVTKIADDVTYMTNDSYFLQGNEYYYLWNKEATLKGTLPFSDAVKIAGSNGAYFALRKNGDLWAWGNNDSGAVGNGGEYDSMGFIRFAGSVPSEGWYKYPIKQSKPVKILDDIKDIWINDRMICAIDEDGSTWVWGDGERVQFYIDGNGNRGSVVFPKNEKTFSPRKETVKEWESNLAIDRTVYKADGTLWTRESNDDGAGLTYVGRWFGTEPQPLFKDIPLSMYCADPVKWAVDKNVTSGTSATTFSPDQNCSQAHILTFLWRAAGKPVANLVNPFTNSEISTDQYYYDAFLWAYAEGLIDDVNINPNAGCSRSDVVSYLWKLEGMPAAKSGNVFSDVSANADYADAVAWAVQKGVTSGTSATTFSPAQVCTRGQIVTFLYRYFA